MSVMQKQFDASRAEAFGGRMVGIVNDASLALMISWATVPVLLRP